MSRILFSKQLRFWATHSTDHLTVELVDEVTNVVKYIAMYLTI